VGQAVGPSGAGPSSTRLVPFALSCARGSVALAAGAAFCGLPFLAGGCAGRARAS
jgi:hypothetical protein